MKKLQGRGSVRRDGVILLILFGFFQGLWASNEPGDWQTGYSYICEKHDWGIWRYPGQAPPACKASSYGNTHKAEHVYRDYILNKTGMYDYPIESGGYKRRLSEKGAAELTRYTTNMNYIIEEFAKNFIADAAKEEDRELGADERNMFINCVVSTVAQESYFSHYRYNDASDPRPVYKSEKPSELYFLVGDSHSKTPGYYWARGLMQFHPAKHGVDEQIVFDLAQSLYYGIDYFYANWNRAKKGGLSCDQQINDSKLGTYWENICKATYSAHNGGGRRICRWHTADTKHDTFKNENPGCWWGRKDFNNDRELKRQCDKARTRQAFIYDLDFKARITGNPKYNEWRQLYLAEKPTAPMPVEYDCLLNGFDLCAMPEERHSEYLKGQLVRLNFEGVFNDRNFCVLSELDGRFHCTADEKAVACLNKHQKLESMALFNLRTQYGENMPVVYNNRLQLCENSFSGFANVGDFIQTQKDITLRGEPRVRSASNPTHNAGNAFWHKPPTGKAHLVRTEKGGVYQVLDFEINADPNFCRSGSQCRFYKIAVTKDDVTYEGYVFGGSEYGRPWQEWATPVNSKNVSSLQPWVIPQKGQKVKVTSPKGLPFLVGDFEAQKENFVKYAEQDGQYNEKLRSYTENLHAREVVYNACSGMSLVSRAFSDECSISLGQMRSNIEILRNEKPTKNFSFKPLLARLSEDKPVSEYDYIKTLAADTEVVVRDVIVEGESEELFLEVSVPLYGYEQYGPTINGYIPAGRLRDVSSEGIQSNIEQFVKIIALGSDHEK